MDATLLYVTAESVSEAKVIGRALVESKLAACANIHAGTTSIYRWDGEIQEDNEAVLILKTRRDLIEKATAEIMRRHSYECPCVIAIPITGGNPVYLNWIMKETL
jgi:periplasmic divalent cation tolerance protein